MGGGDGRAKLCDFATTMGWRKGLAALFGAMIGVLACGETTPAPKNPPASSPGKEAPKPEPSAAPADDGKSTLAAPTRMPTAEPVGKGKPATGQDETTDVVSGQCDELEKILAKLVFEDLNGKLPAKMDPAQREQQEKKNADAARQTAGQFGDMCHRTMVGKAIQRTALECMFKARTFAVFEGCTR